MNTWLNLDLLSVGVVVAAMGVLSFAVYFSRKKSITNRIFLTYSIVTIIWSLLNFFQYRTVIPEISLIILRFELFFAVWQSFFLFLFFYVYPNDKKRFNKLILYFILPYCLLTSILTLTPLVFNKIISVSNTGELKALQVGPAMPLFASIAIGLIISAFIIMIGKINKATKVEKKQMVLIIFGALVTYFLIIIFNFILPAFFHVTNFLSLGAIFIFPFIFLTGYSILKFRLFNIRVIWVTLIISFLSFLVFIGVFLSKDIRESVSGIVIFFLIFSTMILLLRGIIFEAQTREKIENLVNELESANKKLQELDELKSEFMSLATHNISTPLTAVNGYISLLQEEHSQEMSKEGKSLLDTARRSTTNLVNVIRDFLDVSRLERGKVLYNYTQFDVKASLDHIIKKYSVTTESRGLKLSYIKENDADFQIYADKEKFEQAISNIIDNTIRYTQQGEIKIELTKQQNKCYVIISDTSIRKVPVMSEKLAKKFTETGGADEANIIGHGLGLYVAKQYIEGQSGTFQIRQQKNGWIFFITMHSNFEETAQNG